MLPGWYGFGTAVEAWLRGARPDGARAARAKCTSDWPFFRSVLSNMDMVLAKTDLAIASRYAELVPDARCATRSSARIAAEHGAHRARTCVAITGRATLLDDNPTLARSIRNRFPYLDPLNHLQVELLRRYRAGQTDERDEARRSTSRSTASPPACATAADRRRAPCVAASRDRTPCRGSV